MQKTKTTKITTMKISFPVTQTHIETGECRIPTKCAIRQALIEHLDAQEGDETNHYVSVTGDRARFSYDGWMYEVAPLPRKAVNFLWDFDHKLDPKPFVFSAKAVRGRRKQHRDDQEQVNANRQARHAAGKFDKKYGKRRRSIGLVRIPAAPVSP